MTSKIRIIDEKAGWIYYCDTREEAQLVRAMLDMVGAGYKELSN